MPPGKNMDDWWTILRSGMWRLLFKLSREGKARFYKEFLPILHDTKQRVLGERDGKSYYLVYLGTKPSARGKGYARRLIEHGLSMVRPPLLVPLPSSPSPSPILKTPPASLLTHPRPTPTACQHTSKAAPQPTCPTTRNSASTTSRRSICSEVRSQFRSVSWCASPRLVLGRRPSRSRSRSRTVPSSLILLSS